MESIGHSDRHRLAVQHSTARSRRMSSVLALLASTVPQSDAAYAVGFLGRLAVYCVVMAVVLKAWVEPWMKCTSRWVDRIIEARGRGGAWILTRRLVCGTIVVLALLALWLMVTSNPVLYGTKSLTPLVVMFLSVPYYCFVGMMWGKTVAPLDDDGE